MDREKDLKKLERARKKSLVWLRSSLTVWLVVVPLVVWARIKLELPWPATIVIIGFATFYTVLEAVNVVVLRRKIRRGGAIS